jgi:predicted MFS family arabinose efflux permease
VRDPRVLHDVCITTVWAAGIWAIYAYLGVLAEQVVGGGSSTVTAMLVVYGLAGMLGVTLSGRIIDRVGSKAVLLISTGALALIYFGLAILSNTMQGPAACWP